MNQILQLFSAWPESIPKKGSALTSFGELIPFTDYLLNGELVLLVRAQPDAQGTRRSIVPISQIVAIKFQDAIDPDRFSAMGFRRPAAPPAGVRPAGSAAPVIRGPV